MVIGQLHAKYAHFLAKSRHQDVNQVQVLLPLSPPCKRMSYTDYTTHTEDTICTTVPIGQERSLGQEC